MNRQLLRSGRHLARKPLRLASGGVARACARFWARLYYGLLDRSFDEEQRAFLAGQRAYTASLEHPEVCTALLRRNIHRIEKGLLMRPRRTPFALDYIGETVDAFVATLGAAAVDPREMEWAGDVLTEYFRVCRENHDGLSAARSRFMASRPQEPTDHAPLIPYPRDLSSAPPVGFDALMALAVRRRSVRWFLQKPVPREMIDRAIELGCLAPSACNRQPFEYRVFDAPEWVRQINAIPGGLKGYRDGVPCIAVIIGKQRNFFSPRDRHLIYIDASLAAMGFLLGLEAQGLASCCVNWPEVTRNNDKLSALLNLAPDERPVLLVAIGYPDPIGMVARSTKKSLSRLRRYNFE